MKLEIKRKLTQVICALLYNCHFTGFAQGSIYKGELKSICVPGLNCYSCPGAIGACPLGSLQSALLSSKYRFPYYVLGLLLLFGVVLGRFICGFLCPFGWLQELLHAIPTKKLQKSAVTHALTKVKFVVLAVFVIALPLLLGEPGFCKYICPAGTLEGGIPLTALREELRMLCGSLFTWKMLVLVLVLVGVVFIYRGFCRFLCPLGAFYSLFHGVQCVGVKINKEKCTNCGACITKCKMDVRKIGDSECIHCGKCIDACNEGAISFGILCRQQNDSKQKIDLEKGKKL